ncbi:MAG: Amino acid adenylation protein [Pedosphaera sp.]|nr:Amino acid adenylation protein [Pedosphaera sp.]
MKSSALTNANQPAQVGAMDDAVSADSVTRKSKQGEPGLPSNLNGQPALARGLESGGFEGWGAGTLHEIFQAQVEKSPEACAVTFEGEKLTYCELNQRANQLAHHLRKLGVGPDTLVGVCLDRSLEMVIGILGVLKAGGAYVPLDLAYPRERVAFILADAKVKVILTQEKLREKLDLTQTGETAGTAPRILCLDKDWGSIAQESTANPDSGAQPEHLAYVIYTSGSTGAPKGVLVTHYNVARLFTATDAWFQFGPKDVWTLFHSYAFDFSVWEIWGALLYGGRLVVVPYLVSRSPDAFYEFLAREKVTVLNQTPSAFRQLIWAEASSSQTRELSLRYVIFGGEALELQSLKPWFDRHGDQQPVLVNMYGITETTVHVTYRPLTMQDVTDGKGSVIGVPIPDLRIHILDEKLQPVAAGVEGEMYVAGAGLARGYFNRPELTAERFIVDRFSKVPGERLYKTGDLARFLPDGDLEYLGRCDHQVKIRGFRIELGEIESVLNRHPAIRENVTIALAGLAGEKRLVAYAVLRPGALPAISDLRTFLKVHLPDYMIPSAFVFLPALPLTTNGKVDRRALPEPEAPSAEPISAQALPQTQTEQIIANIWREVLQRGQVGLEDNFFDLGGNSLQLAHVQTRLHEHLNVDLPITRLFEFTTINALARHLNSQTDGGSAKEQFADRARRQKEVQARQRQLSKGKK